MSLYSLHDLIESATSTQKQVDDGGWIPARPENYRHIPFWTKLRLVWAFWCGKYDLVRWPTSSAEWRPTPQEGSFDESSEFFKEFNRLVESSQKLDIINQALADYSMMRSSSEKTPQQKAGQTRTINALIREAVRYSRKVDVKLEDMLSEFHDRTPELDRDTPSNLPPKYLLVKTALSMLLRDLQSLRKCGITHSTEIEPEFWDRTQVVLEETTELLRVANQTPSAVTNNGLLRSLETLYRTANGTLRSLRAKRKQEALYMTQVVSSISRLESALSNAFEGQQGF